MRRVHHELILPAKIDVRALAAVSKFAGADTARSYLMGVRVEVGFRDVVYIATDGKRLLALRLEKLRDEPENDMTGAFTIPTVHTRAFKIKKDEDGTADLYGDAERLTLKRGDIELSFTPIPGDDFIGRWVDWRHVLPREPLSAGTGQFDYSQMASFQKFSDEMSGGYHPYVAHNGSDGGALIRFHHIDAIGVVMPVKIDDQRTSPVPDWARVPAWSWPSEARRSEEGAEAEPAAEQPQAAAPKREEGEADLFDKAAAAPDPGAEQGEQAPEAPEAQPEPGDDLAAQQQRGALAAVGSEDAGGEQEATPLGDAVQQNVDRLAGIQQLKADEVDPIGEGAAAGEKPRRRRRTAEERVAENAAAVAAGAPPKSGRGARSAGSPAQ